MSAVRPPPPPPPPKNNAPPSNEKGLPAPPPPRRETSNEPSPAPSPPSPKTRPAAPQTPNKRPLPPNSTSGSTHDARPAAVPPSPTQPKSLSGSIVDLIPSVRFCVEVSGASYGRLPEPSLGRLEAAARSELLQCVQQHGQISDLELHVTRQSPYDYVQLKGCYRVVSQQIADAAANSLREYIRNASAFKQTIAAYAEATRSVHSGGYYVDPKVCYVNDEVVEKPRFTIRVIDRVSQPKAPVREGAGGAREEELHRWISTHGDGASTSGRLPARRSVAWQAGSYALGRSQLRLRRPNCGRGCATRAPNVLHSWWFRK